MSSRPEPGTLSRVVATPYVPATRVNRESRARSACRPLRGHVRYRVQVFRSLIAAYVFVGGTRCCEISSGRLHARAFGFRREAHDAERATTYVLLCCVAFVSHVPAFVVRCRPMVRIGAGVQSRSAHVCARNVTAHAPVTGSTFTGRRCAANEPTGSRAFRRLLYGPYSAPGSALARTGPSGVRSQRSYRVAENARAPVTRPVAVVHGSRETERTGINVSHVDNRFTVLRITISVLYNNFTVTPMVSMADRRANGVC